MPNLKLEEIKSNYKSKYYVQKKDFKFWGHNCFSISNNKTTLIIDPWFSNSGAFYSCWFQYPKNHKFQNNVIKLLAEIRNSFILISHEHQDH